MSQDIFFSIIIPAHNEEKYIEETLKHLQELEYPKESYEVIVVENASTDKTLEKAKAFASESFRIFSVPEPGVSNARNFGVTQSKKDSENENLWVFFLDADTFPDPPFLRSLSNFIKAHVGSGYIGGAAQLTPIQNSFFEKMLYWFSNTGLRITHSANGSALFVRRVVLDSVTFDAQLAVGEDEVFARKLQQHGKFFFFSTNLIHTSTRRFQNGGWKKIPAWVAIWIFAILVPHNAKFTSSLQRRLKYEVVR